MASDHSHKTYLIECTCCKQHLFTTSSHRAALLNHDVYTILFTMAHMCHALKLVHSQYTENLYFCMSPIASCHVTTRHISLVKMSTHKFPIEFGMSTMPCQARLQVVLCPRHTLRMVHRHNECRDFHHNQRQSATRHTSCNKCMRLQRMHCCCRFVIVQQLLHLNVDLALSTSKTSRRMQSPWQAPQQAQQRFPASQRVH
jgi:hypothetical protein